MNNDLMKLKTSLCDVIDKWMNDQTEVGKEWDMLDTNIADNTAELMAESAFNILLAQSSLTKYLRHENILDQ